ncbi:putative membrane protein [Cytobacillus kochii]|uniref:Uncharacterized protein n=1 Tax=Cytobacillus kochii TaxID=859143 RepID=A0A248TM77_9BACI|nr:hypothetical protein CKF48_19690 [Cytobacillus kochii]MDQ0184085.1 putative membrane protein [Cytobacillus kochii]
MIPGILLWCCFALSIIFLISGIFNHSYVQALLSFVLFLPLSCYLFRIDHFFQYFFLFPIIPLIAFWYIFMKKRT